MLEDNNNINEDSSESKKTQVDNLELDDINKKQNHDKEMKEKFLIFFKEWIIPIALAIAIALSINKFLAYIVYIPSESMAPTLNVEDKLLVTKVYDKSKIKRGDIIVFYSHELQEVVIKRAIGLPGDHIVIHQGIVNINGEDIKEDYVKNNEKFDGTFDVPQGKYFFLGDNRRRSNDARRWINSYIEASDIQGKAQIKFYPIKDFGILK